MYLECIANKTIAILSILSSGRRETWARSSGPSIWDLRAARWCRFRVARSSRGCYDRIKRHMDYGISRNGRVFFSDRRIYRHAEIERGIVKYSCGFTSVTWWSCARIVRERKGENNFPIFYFHSLYVIWLDFILRDISTRNPLLYEWYTRNGPPNNLIAVLY